MFAYDKMILLSKYKTLSEMKNDEIENFVSSMNSVLSDSEIINVSCFDCTIIMLIQEKIVSTINDFKKRYQYVFDMIDIIQKSHNEEFADAEDYAMALTICSYDEYPLLEMNKRTGICSSEKIFGLIEKYKESNKTVEKIILEHFIEMALMYMSKIGYIDYKRILEFVAKKTELHEDNLSIIDKVNSMIKNAEDSK